MKWYKERYVNHRDWILDHLEILGLNAEELMLVLLIDFANEHRMAISMSSLHEKTGLPVETVNRIISLLVARGQLQIITENGSVIFQLDSLFEVDTKRREKTLDASLFDAFETEFKRPLSQREMEKISEWSRRMDRRLILLALREAAMYRKANILYIERVLDRWRQKGMTAEMIEKGESDDRRSDSQGTGQLISKRAL